MHPCLGLYRQAVRGILRLLWGRSVWRSVFCGHPCRVLLSWRAPWEVCMLHALQTPLAPPPTQYMFDRTVVHLEIFSFFPTCLDYVQSWTCFTALSSFQTRLWESYASLLWRMFPSERKNAIHGHFGMTHLLKWVFLELSSSKSFPDWSVSQWFAIFTIATVCHRYLFFVGLFSWKTGRLFLLMREAEWTILPISHLSFSKNLQTGGMPRITLSIMTTISSFVVEARKTVLLSRWTFWPVVLSADLSLSTKILDRVPCPSLSLPVIIKRTCSRIDYLCLFLQPLSKSMLLLLGLLSALFGDSNMFCSCSSKISFTTVPHFC